MTADQSDVARIIATDRVFARRAHPELAEAAHWLLRQGRLVAVLPGVYAPGHASTTFETLVAAVSAWRPDAVLTGAGAARSTFWPEIQVRHLEVAVPRRSQVRPQWMRVTERRIPTDLRISVGALEVTVPALTALDLCPVVGGDGIDRVLQRRAATLSELRAALAATPGRRENLDRARLLLQSRSEPHSRAEREAHALFRAAGLTGWSANHRVVVAGSVFLLDIAFEALMLVVEIDGREFHSSTSAFEEDRRRQNLLVNAGWRVLRFTWRMLLEQPAWVVEVVRDAMAAAGWMAR